MLAYSPFFLSLILINFTIMERPFKQRVHEFWHTFSKDIQKYEKLIDRAQDKSIETKEIVGEFSRLLNIAFSEPFYNVGKAGDKYELIMTPEGNRNTLLLINYWKSQMPEDVFDNWNIFTTKPAMQNLSPTMGLNMHGADVNIGDVEVYYSADDNSKKLDLQILSPKLMALSEDQRYSMLFILLDICIGELNVMQNIGAIRFVDSEPQGSKPATLIELTDKLEDEFRANGWELSTSSLDRYVTYSLKAQNENLRQDVYAGFICSTDIINDYLEEQDNLFLTSFQDGVVYGFVYYNNQQIPNAEVVTFRQKVEDEIIALVEKDKIASYIGGATGERYSYMDFIIYDIDEFMPLAKKVLNNYSFSEKGYCDFIHSAKPIQF